ncbi:MAG: alanine racemase [Ruminococcaceae bacterium]|nr:alanine racemase [Oscillospiraceae bacterium]
MQDVFYRTWVDIDLDAVRHNLSLVRSRVENAEIMCIVKADAYGHGVEQTAMEMQRAGIRWFGVSNIEEAVELRRCGIRGDILILGYTAPAAVELLCDHNIHQAVFSAQYARSLSLAACEKGRTVRCHIKVDTGMGRIGLNCRTGHAEEQQAQVCAEICRMNGLSADGIFTHFAVADEGEDGEAFTRAQYASFTALISRLKEMGISFRWRHCCNSAGLLEYPDMQLDMVRPGVILYGLSPSSVIEGKYDLHPVMQLRTVISMVKPLEKGATVSYGRTFCAPRDMVLATVPIGYADGYPRILSGRQDMLVRGQRVPVVGRVCMDQLMLDVTEVPGVKEGDVVTAFGRDGDCFIPVEEMTDKMGTVNYELVCRMTRRVPRLYHRGGKIIAQTNYIL